MKKYIKCKNNFGEIVSISADKFVFRPCAYGLIINDKKILTLKNKGNGKIWFPGGGVNINETIYDALKREIKEETGLNITIGKLALYNENFFYYQPLNEAYHAFLFFFICKTKKYELISDGEVDDLESKEPRWTEISSIKKEDIGDLEDDLFKTINNLI